VALTFNCVLNDREAGGKKCYESSKYPEQYICEFEF
jgi:hypothetical protein